MASGTDVTKNELDQSAGSLERPTICHWELRHVSTIRNQQCPLTGELVGRRIGDSGFRLCAKVGRDNGFGQVQLVAASVAKTAPASLRAILAKIALAQPDGENAFAVVPCAAAAAATFCPIDLERHGRELEQAGKPAFSSYGVPIIQDTPAQIRGIASAERPIKFGGEWGIASRASGGSTNFKLLGLTAIFKYCPTLGTVLCETYGVETPPQKVDREAQEARQREQSEARQKEQAEADRRAARKADLRAALQTIAEALTAGSKAQPSLTRAGQIVTALSEWLGLRTPPEGMELLSELKEDGGR